MILMTCSGLQPIYCSPVAPTFAVIVIPSEVIDALDSLGDEP